MTIEPPASTTDAATESASSTATYMFQLGTASDSAGPMAATSAPSSAAIM
jgi:hypothetical protein